MRNHRSLSAQYAGRPGRCLRNLSRFWRQGCPGQKWGMEYRVEQNATIADSITDTAPEETPDEIWRDGKAWMGAPNFGDQNRAAGQLQE